ncbi:hypothetical protein ABH921_002170 [Kocuria sp. MT07]
MNHEPAPEAAAASRGSSDSQDAPPPGGPISGPESTPSLNSRVHNGPTTGSVTPHDTSIANDTSTAHDSSGPQESSAPQESSVGRESPAGSGSGRDDVPGSVVPRTGFGPVDAVLAREPQISRMPVAQRAAVFAELHTELERILAQDPASLPAGLVPPGPPRPGSQSPGSPASESQSPALQSPRSQSPASPSSVAGVPGRAPGQNHPAGRESR